MRYLPRWFPGAGFQDIARKMRADLVELYDVPFDYVKSQMVSKSHMQWEDFKVYCCSTLQSLDNFEPSFTSRYITENEPLSSPESDFIKAAAASLYSGQLFFTFNFKQTLTLIY